MKKKKKKYEARVQAIQTWMLQAKVTSLDEDSFALFLSDLLLKTRNPCSSTAEGYRSAIVFLQKRDGLWTQQDGLWASSATCKALVQGYGFNAKQVMPRGAVEEDLYIEMMTYIEIHYRYCRPDGSEMSHPHLGLPLFFVPLPTRFRNGAGNSGVQCGVLQNINPAEFPPSLGFYTLQ